MATPHPLPRRADVDKGLPQMLRNLEEAALSGSSDVPRRLQALAQTAASVGAVALAHSADNFDANAVAAGIQSLRHELSCATRALQAQGILSRSMLLNFERSTLDALDPQFSRTGEGSADSSRSPSTSSGDHPRRSDSQSPSVSELRRRRGLAAVPRQARGL